MSRQLVRAVLSLSLLLLSVLPVVAQAPTPPPAPYQPPAMRFDAKGLTLADAIRLTLQHDPNIKLRETDTQKAQGVLQTQQGRFDTVFNASGAFNRSQVDMLDSDKEKQVQVRADLDASIIEVTTLSASLLAANTNLGDSRIYTNPRAVNFTSGVRDADIANQMNILGSQLILFDDILKSPTLTDQTVKDSIVNLRQLTVDKNVASFLAQRNTIKDAPGLLQRKRDRLGDAPTEQWNRASNVHLDLTRIFRSGLSVQPYVDLNYSSANYVGKDLTSGEDGGLGVEPLYEGKIGFEVVLPLMRGMGSRSVAAAETAAKYDLEASRLAILHQQSQSVLSTIQAYWEARAAADLVEVMRRSVEVQGELANLTRSLIAANERPRSEEARVSASAADARSRYEAAQRRLTDARITLAKVMGVALADALAIPLAADAFPKPPATLQADPAAYAALIKEALGRRNDRQAALKLEASGKTLVDGARIDLRPLLNVTASSWGTSQAQTTPQYGRWVFRSGSVALDYQLPLGNNTARGTLDQRLSALNSSKIDTADLERTIALNITQYAESLKLAADRLRAAEEAVRNYEETIKTEQLRFRAGDSSLLDTLLTEQQTTSARATRVTAQQDFSTLLALLSYESGLLVHNGTVNISNLVAAPAALLRR